MNLHVILDKRHFKRNFDLDDLIVVNDNFNFKPEVKIFNVDEVYFDEDKQFDYSQKILELFKKFDKTLFSYTNNFYTNTYLPLLKVINTIEILVENNNINKIFLYGGSNEVEFIPYYFAEGETQKIFLYESPMYMNYYLYKYFKKNHNIIFKEKDSILKINTFKLTRRYLFLVFKFLYMFLFHFNISKKTENLNYSFSNNKKNIVFPVRNIAQVTSIENLYQFLRKNEKYNPVFFVYERVLSHQSNTTNYLKEQNYNTLQIYKDAPIYKTICKSFANVFKNIFHTNKTVSNTIFSIKELSNEIYLMNFEKEVYSLLLESKLSKFSTSIDLLISTEIKSPEAFIENRLANKHGIKSYNLQAQSIMKRPLPTFSMNGTFLFENLIDYKYFNKFPYPDKESMEFIGSFKYFNLIENKFIPINNKKKIIYFTQNHEHENQSKIINTIIDNLLKDQILYIKKHPRDNTVYDNFINNKNVFLEKRLDLNVIIQDIDIVISRTTTLLLDAILYKKIVIAIVLSSFDKNGQQVYINCDYINIIYTLDELNNFNDRCIDYNIKYNFNRITSDLYSSSNFTKNFCKVFNETI